MIMLELLIQLATCLIKSEQEQERILRNNYLREFKLLMRQMFWIGRHNPSVMEEAMHELRHHFYSKDNREMIDRCKHEKQMNDMLFDRDRLRQQVTRGGYEGNLACHFQSLVVRRSQSSVRRTGTGMYDADCSERTRPP